MGPQVGRTASKVLFKRLTGVSPIISENIVRYFDDFVESAAVLFTYNSSPSCSQNLWPEFSFFLRHSEHVQGLKAIYKPESNFQAPNQKRPIKQGQQILKKYVVPTNIRSPKNNWSQTNIWSSNKPCDKVLGAAQFTERTMH